MSYLSLLLLLLLILCFIIVLSCDGETLEVVVISDVLESALTDAEANDDAAHDADDQQQEATGRGCHLYSKEGSLGNACNGIMNG